MGTDIFQVAVCEDAAADTAALESLLEKSGIPMEYRSFEKGEAFLRTFAAGRYDLVFIDIYMSGMRGVEVAEAIRGTDENVVIAFTTSSTAHTLESYRLGALKYLVKPIKAEEVRQTLELALMVRKSRSFISLMAAGGKREDIPLNNILYFEHKNHVVEAHTSSGVFITSQSVKIDDIEKRLPSPPFLRCHRSFLVNLDYVLEVNREQYAFIMKNGDRADIRRGNLTRYAGELDKWRLYVTGRGVL